MIDDLEKTSGSSAGSKPLLLTRRTDRVGQMARMVFRKTAGADGERRTVSSRPSGLTAGDASEAFDNFLNETSF